MTERLIVDEVEAAFMLGASTFTEAKQILRDIPTVKDRPGIRYSVEDLKKAAGTCGLRQVEDASAPVDPRALMLPGEAADYLRISPHSLAAWRFKQEGPLFIKMGKRVFYRRSDLDQWIAATAAKTEQERDRIFARFRDPRHIPPAIKPKRR
jgi:hypothetical protein